MSQFCSILVINITELTIWQNQIFQMYNNDKFTGRISLILIIGVSLHNLRILAALHNMNWTVDNLGGDHHGYFQLLIFRKKDNRKDR